MNIKVDEFLSKTKKWSLELEKLRSIFIYCGLTEELKWRVPCYTFNDKNIALLGGFKEYCVISFFKGVLLKDKSNILVSVGENTQSSKVIKFTHLEEIIELESIIKAYIFEAIEIEKLGLKVDFKANEDVILVKELQDKLDADKEFKTAFEKLTKGRQRGYNLYFSAAKQSKTRIVRIEKYKNQIFEGKGINDCTCGLSKKMPSCDGSHKFI
ncbi:DUF1801 domain-containing protein [Bernardetia sp. Wsw4-3y2]|uniref:DUF1801 domain-containing protein n=1 Tax=Bernardetia sp. Wsw4-3y2 TaxID=3127471 RepID=UPI0030D0C1A7